MSLRFKTIFYLISLGDILPKLFTLSSKDNPKNILKYFYIASPDGFCFTPFGAVTCIALCPVTAFAQSRNYSSSFTASVKGSCASQVSERASVLMPKIYSYRKERLSFKTCHWSVDLKQDPVRPGWIPKPREMGGGQTIPTWVLRVTATIQRACISCRSPSV